MQAVTGVQLLPTLVSISNLVNAEGQPLLKPFWQPIKSGMSYGISEKDVNDAYLRGLKQGSPQGLLMPVQISLPSGKFTALAPAIPDEYQNGRMKPYWDTIPWNLPSFYPINVTFSLAGNMYASTTFCLARNLPVMQSTSMLHMQAVISAQLG